MIQAVTHKLVNYYVRYRMYTDPLKSSWLFVMLLGKIPTNAGNHKNMEFH